MKAYEFPAQITSEGKLKFSKFSAQVLQNLPINKQVRVIVLVNESTDQELEENSDWSRLAGGTIFCR